MPFSVFVTQGEHREQFIFEDTATLWDLYLRTSDSFGYNIGNVTLLKAGVNIGIDLPSSTLLRDMMANNSELQLEIDIDDDDEVPLPTTENQPKNPHLLKPPPLKLSLKTPAKSQNVIMFCVVPNTFPIRYRRRSGSPCTRPRGTGTIG